MEMDRPKTMGIVLHSTGGNASNLRDEYYNTLVYIKRPGVQASYHYLVGPDEINCFVNIEDVAWHAKENNHTHLGVAFAQPASNPGITEFQYEAMAAICTRLSRLYGIPMRRVYSQKLWGWVEHKDTEQGQRDHKIDVGGKFDWEHFMKLVRSYKADKEQIKWNIERALERLNEGRS